jgi:hypothetical protein
MVWKAKKAKTAFEHGCNEFIRVIKYAGISKNHSVHQHQSNRLCTLRFAAKAGCADV